MLRFVTLILLWTTLLHAVEDFAYSMHISNPRPVVKEAVILTLELNQTRTGNVMRFDFSLTDSDDYQAALLEEDETQDSENRTHIVIKYAIFPLRPKHLEIPLHVTVQQASPEELKKFVTGSADELTYLRTTDRSYPLPKIVLDVSPLPQKSKLVGDYHLDFSIDANRTEPNGQINLTYTLSGRGYRPDLESILPAIPDIESFLATEHFDNKLFHKTVYHYALIPQKSFTVPAVVITAYHPRRHALYRLEAPEAEVSVTPAKRSARKGTDLMMQIPWERFRELLNGMTVFAAGFLTFYIVRLYRTRRNTPRTRAEDLHRKIKDAKTYRDLLQILLSEDRVRYREEIATIESVLYHDGKASLSQLKRAIEPKIADESERFYI